MSSSVDISKFLAGLKQAEAAVRKSAERAMNRFGQAVLTNARQRCPVEWGDLKRSGTTEPAIWGGSGFLTKVIGFNSEYAVYVHERLDLYHKEGEAKFLENAVREMHDDMGTYIVAEVKKNGF